METDGLIRTGEAWRTWWQNCLSVILSPWVPHRLGWDRTHASTVEGRPLTAWNMARTVKLEVHLNCALSLSSLHSKQANTHQPAGSARDMIALHCLNLKERTNRLYCVQKCRVIWS